MLDISVFRERTAPTAMSVSELTSYVKGVFENDKLLSSVNVSGEISNFKAHSSGHFYFTLKDSDSQIKCVMFRSSTASVRFQPKDGMKVIVRGSVSVYPRDGSYQLYASRMEPDGVGALYLAYEQLKSRLAEEGLFDSSHKRTIPRFPLNVGVITSPTGAAVRDIINVISRRCPAAGIYIYPALVQGEGSEESLIRGLEYFDKSRSVDVIIIGRGGGSLEDLWAFNGERLARKIFSLEIPVISAVGHETDFTICDFVSDLRAPTPSAAAELAVPDSMELRMRIADLSTRCEGGILRIGALMRDRLQRVLASAAFSSASKIYIPFEKKLLDAEKAVQAAYREKLLQIKGNFATILAKLDALNPLSIIRRGYSVVKHNRQILRDSSMLEVGDRVEVLLGKGGFFASVEEIT